MDEMPGDGVNVIDAVIVIFWCAVKKWVNWMEDNVSSCFIHELDNMNMTNTYK